MTIKPALSVSEQVKLLQTRGLIIENPSSAEALLLQNSYYRLNIYFHKYMKAENCFKVGTTFEDIVAVYEFDRWLRNRLLTLLEPIEIHIKTRIAYRLSHSYGSDCFYKDNCFKNIDDFKKVTKDFENERNRNYKDPIILHHETAYRGKYPIWVVVEFLSFRAVSNIFACMHERDKKQIAKDAYNVNEYFLGQWLHTLSVLRNICAHYGYLEPIRITLVNLEYDRRNRDDGKEANTGANAEQQNDDGFSNIRRVVGGDTAVIARA